MCGTLMAFFWLVFFHSVAASSDAFVDQETASRASEMAGACLCDIAHCCFLHYLWKSLAKFCWCQFLLMVRLSRSFLKSILQGCWLLFIHFLCKYRCQVTSLEANHFAESFKQTVTSRYEVLSNPTYRERCAIR